MSASREKSYFEKTNHLRGEVLWICCNRSNSTRPSSWPLLFNHFCVNLKTTMKCTKKSASSISLQHISMICTLWGLRLKQQWFYCLIHRFKSSHLWWVTVHFVPGFNCCHQITIDNTKTVRCVVYCWVHM